MKITFGILAHVDAGKTTFSEQVLYREGVTRTLGRVDTKNAYMDHDDIERARGITIFSDMACFIHGDNTYYLIDTPGHTDFSAEMERALEVMDYAVLIINGTDGIQGHTEAIWNLLERYNIPAFIFVNKLDAFSASYERVLSEIRERFSAGILDFQNICFEKGAEATLTDDLIENVSEWDEELLEKWLDGTITFEDLRPAMVSQIKNRRLFPCFGGCALGGEGIEPFLNAFYHLTETSYLISAPFSGRVFKIRYDDHGERMTYLKILRGFLRVRDSLPEDEKLHQIRIFQGERFRSLQEASAGDVVAQGGDFREAVYRAIRQGLMKAKSFLLEPYYCFTISVSPSLTGRVLNDITKYSGRFEAPVSDGSIRTVIKGLAPIASFMNYGEELMIMTGGKGSISMVFSHYDRCHNGDELLNHYHYNPNEDTDNPSCSVFCKKGTSFVVNWDHAEEYMHSLF